MIDQDVHSHHHTDNTGSPAGGYAEGLGILIRWQNGPTVVRGVAQEPNGAFVEGVVRSAITRLEYYDAIGLGSADTAEALDHLKAALSALDADTIARGSSI
jgi:hypothetical protein